MTGQNNHRACVLIVATLIWATALSAHAQFKVQGDSPIQGLPGLDGLIGAPADLNPVKIHAEFSAPSADQPARLFITAQIHETYHVYSLNQGTPPQKTKIRVNESDDFQRVGSFQANSPPKIIVNPPDALVWPNVRLEEHYGKVTWYAPIEFSLGVILEDLEISGEVDLQACDATSCVPFLLSFTAKLGPGIEVGSPAPPKLTGSTLESEYRAKGSSITIRGHVEPQVVAPGGTAHLTLTALPDSAWHVYAREDRDPEEISKPTLIVVEDAADLTVYRATTPSQPIEDNQEALGLGIQRYHEGAVTWTLDVVVPEGAEPGERTLSGIIGYQVCQLATCQPPLAARFQGVVTVGEAPTAGQVPLVFAAAKYRDAAQAAVQNPVPPAAPGSVAGAVAGGSSMAVILGFAFLGGLILNLMPCVLPVIGLKVMSFVEQAGQSRGRAFMLNVWYSVGVISVFLIVATMAVSFEMPVGSQFGNDVFNIGLSALVFAMALSLIGVWEIPIPGFVGGGKTMDFADKEGPTGAIVKGILTTILATPCIGPFLGPALGWALQQPPATAYLVFTSAGVGMASPYLIIGAFPVLIRFVPKPGMWMVTFKQIMGFVLIGTVVFLLTFIHPKLIVPTVTLLAGIAAACWWIARTPAAATGSQKAAGWLGGTAFAALVGLFAFGFLGEVMDYRFQRAVSQHVAASGGEVILPHAEGELPWQMFTPRKLDQLTSERKTVMVDFTADWCMICKTLESQVLNTDQVIDAVTLGGVVTLQADFTRKSPEIASVLKELESAGVPVLAIYPAGSPDKPIVFKGPYTIGDVLAALEKAGPSQPIGRSSSTVMTAQ